MEVCKQCKKNHHIVNKKYQLCDDCNYKRLHKGKSKQEIFLEKKKNKPTLYKKVQQFKNKKPIKQQTIKQSNRQIELSRLKFEIELEAKQHNNYFCWGCGVSVPHLDKSHILSIGKRKDLELEKDNINLFCRSCHQDWESGDIEKMGGLESFHKDMNYIKNNDRNRYNQLFSLIEQYLNERIKLKDEEDYVYHNLYTYYTENDFLIL